MKRPKRGQNWTLQGAPLLISSGSTFWPFLKHVSSARGSKNGPSAGWIRCLLEGPVLRPFFPPTPSWLPPGRYTRSIAAKRWIVIIMQGCLLVDSHKSSGSGPVHSPVSCPSKKKKHKPKTKETKQTKNTQPQPNQNKQKHREVGSLPAMGITCMMTSCVSLWEWPPNKKQNKENCSLLDLCVSSLAQGPC